MPIIEAVRGRIAALQARSTGRLTQLHIPPGAYQELREAVVDAGEADLVQGGVVLDGVLVRPMSLEQVAPLLAASYAKLRYSVDLPPAVAASLTKALTDADTLTRMIPLVVDQWADAELGDVDVPERFAEGMRELGLEIPGS